MKSVCLAILNYNGRKHLERLLPTACAAAKHFSDACSVLVLDNCSAEPDVKWVTQEYPSVRVVIAPKNDFLFSYNWLLPQLKDEIAVLLNNDLRVDEHFLQPLIEHFRSSDVFAVSASSYDWEGHERTIGPARLTFRNCFYDWSYDPKRQGLCHTLFTSGGFMAVDRLKFLELGGFNRLFYPAYCEDLDLCFRAWRRGWRCIYEPASVVWHREQASWETIEKKDNLNLGLRNSFLFQWANLPMRRERWKRAVYVSRIFLTHTARLNVRWTSMWIWALWRWMWRRREFKTAKVTESQLMEITQRVDQPYHSDSLPVPAANVSENVLK